MSRVGDGVGQCEVPLGGALVYHPLRCGDALAVLLRDEGRDALDNGSDNTVDDHSLVSVNRLHLHLI